jgi:hypothetical protein
MRKKLLSLGLFIAILAVFQIQAQTDVTSTYLTNANFETSPTMTIGGTQPTDNYMYTISGWTSNLTGAQTYKKLETVPYSTALTALGVTSPANGSSVASNNSYLLGIKTHWQSGPNYLQQTITLPAGKYSLKWDSYVMQLVANGLSYCGVVIGSTPIYLPLADALTTWKNNTLNFTLTSSQSVIVRFGYDKNANTGSTSSPVLFIDNVQLLSYGVDKTDLVTRINDAKAYYNTSGVGASDYLTSIRAAETVNANSGATQADVNTAITTLQTAMDTYVTGNATNVTASLTNPSFETAAFGGWVNSGFAQQTNTPGNNWTKDGTTYAEKWTSNWTTGSTNTLPYLSAATLTQTKTGLSNGKYRMTLSGHAIQQTLTTMTTNGAFAFANSRNLAINNGGNYTMDNISVTDGSFNYGYKLVSPITCNWTGFDNYKLYYLGTGVRTLTPSVSTMLLYPGMNQETFDLVGSNIIDDVTITVPSHITISGTNVVDNANGTYTISSANANATTTITVTWDESNAVNSNITFATTGATTSNLLITGSFDPATLLSKSTMSFNTTTFTGTFNVTGSNLTGDIVLTPPSAIALSGANVVNNEDGTYKILNSNANAMNTVTATWNRQNNVSSATLTVATDGVTPNKTITLNSTEDVETVSITGITLTTGANMTPAYAQATTSYTIMAPANISSVSITAAVNPTVANVTNNGGSISASSTSKVLTGHSYNGSMSTVDYTFNWGGNYTLPDWDANGSTDATMSIPTVYGWRATPTLNWGAANTGVSGTVRYMDINSGAGVSGVPYTYNGGNYTGRILFQRWDGSPSRVYSYPIYLEGCKSYNFTGKVAWNSNTTAPTVTFRINSANDNTGTTYGSTDVVTGAAGTLVDVNLSKFSVPTTGVYYITTTSSTQALISIADLAISDNVEESMGVSPTSLLLYEGHLSKTFTVSGNLLTNDISLSAPNGITLSATGVTPGKDITLLKGDAQCGIVVTATWDNASAIIDQPISLTSGALSQSVNIYADKNDCSAPLYNDHTNLIAEPYMNVLSGYTNSWGALTLATGSEAYCGYASAKLAGVNGGSITTPNISWLANTKYRIRAMVKTTGDFQFGLQNTYAGNGATYEIVIPSTGNTWKQVDYIFTTGASAVAGFAYFNMQGRGGSLGYIDNWEIYNISDQVSEPDFGVKAWEQAVDQNIPTTTFDVAPGGRLTINAAKTLTATNVNLYSDGTGTATLIDNGSITGTVNIKQYLTGSTNSETGAPNGRFWYVTSPIASATSAVFSPSAGNKLWSHSEATASYTQISDDVTTLTPGLGYVARMKDNTTITFTGTPNTGDKTVQVSRTGTSNFFRGYNLVGNPYPSFARIKSDDNVDIESSLWFRTKVAASSAMIFDSYNILTGDSVSGSGNPISGYIPPMQAFWVKKTTVGTANITFKQAYRFHKDPITSGIKLRSAEADTTPCLRIRLSNGSTKDETLIKLYPNATDGFDAYDTHKMTNSLDSFPEIFTMNGKEELAINGMRHDGRGKAVALGFRSGKPGKFTFKVVEKRNMNDSLRVILKDKVRGIEKELGDTTSYEFTTDVPLTTSDRFSIVIGKVATEISKTAASSADVFTDNDRYIHIRLIGATSNNSIVKVYNTMGQEVGKFVNTTASAVLAKQFAPGVYVVNVSSEGLQFNKKVVINQ